MNPLPTGIPTTGLVAAYPMDTDPMDASGHGHHAHTSNVTRTTDRFGAPHAAYHFNGHDSVLTIPDHDDFSLDTTGYLSISAWVRPDGTSLDADGELLFVNKYGSGYVHWLGKGDRFGPQGNREWSFRIYSADNTENRHNRMSFYHFSYDGGRGPGSYVQDPLTADGCGHGTWLHLVAVASLPEHRIWLYKNGVLRDSDGFGPADSYPIADGDLRNGGAPVRMGSQDGNSYFSGAIDDVYFYNRKLDAIEIEALYRDPRQR